jgi:hypothetical protein
MTSNGLAILHRQVQVVFSVEEINYGEWTIDFLQKKKITAIHGASSITERACSR